ncbi:MAG: polysaccharide deacetylase family protein [Candidatus Azobacteroides sp.]|nr:polysaccharide deacetylase family protein [Candidatus Azobacteroides sp.]
MLIEQPPFLYRALFPGVIWRIPSATGKQVFLTFDDGPIPEVTPWVLDELDKYGIKATFFCVGDNVRKYPDVYREIITRGHVTGNHTYHHLQGWKTFTKKYLHNVNKADELIGSGLFRPPHGHIRFLQLASLLNKYNIIMWDVVTRDYSKRMTGQRVFENVKKYSRNGSIIVFHDSLKAEDKLKYALPRSIEYLLKEGYTFKLLKENSSR